MGGKLMVLRGDVKEKIITAAIFYKFLPEYRDSLHGPDSLSDARNANRRSLEFRRWQKRKPFSVQADIGWKCYVIKHLIT